LVFIFILDLDFLKLTTESAAKRNLSWHKLPQIVFARNTAKFLFDKISSKALLATIKTHKPSRLAMFIPINRDEKAIQCESGSLVTTSRFYKTNIAIILLPVMCRTQTGTAIIVRRTWTGTIPRTPIPTSVRVPR
jgi:hypothetical protein